MSIIVPSSIRRRRTPEHWQRVLAPLHAAQLRHILGSKTLAMDKTPIKAGRDNDKGRMKTGWYCPLVSDPSFTFFRTLEQSGTVSSFV